MKIGLIDVDGHNFPNLPLMKISAWHKKQGDHVEWYDPFKHYSTVYMSKVFTFTPDFEYYINADQVERGGTGYGLDNTLPHEIEHTYPDYSIYPQYAAAYGFLTRGCPRGCDFCIVGKKEGLCSRKVADLDEFWSGQKIIKLLDPNLLACTEHKDLLGQLIDSEARIDITQGFDARLVTGENIDLIRNIKVDILHFAWDDPSDNLAEKFRYIKEETGFSGRKLSCYVLTNFNSTMEENLMRIYTLDELGYTPYVMIYEKSTAPPEIRRLQRWVNNKRIFKTCKRFENYKE